ncbi:MAG: hypothetical protein LBT75_03145 [Bacilli bacterium]|jgi:magnesium transporter|nr:hypothetical protein [Bacilli bacterium]
MKKFLIKNNDIIMVNDNSNNLTFYDNDEFDELIKELKINIYLHKENKSSFIKKINNIIYGNIFIINDHKNNNLPFIITDNILYLNIKNNLDINKIIKVIIERLKKHEFNIINIYFVLYFIIDELLHYYFLLNIDLSKQLQDIESNILRNKNVKNNNVNAYHIYQETNRIKYQLATIIIFIDKIKYFINDDTDLNETNYLNYLEATCNHLNNENKIILDQIIQIKELIQNQLDINLNNSMNFFSIVATIFLPLTLIVGWYGMNFNMPEYHWQYGYLVPIILAIISLIITIFLIKRQQNNHNK